MDQWAMSTLLTLLVLTWIQSSSSVPLPQISADYSSNTDGLFPGMVGTSQVVNGSSKAVVGNSIPNLFGSSSSEDTNDILIDDAISQSNGITGLLEKQLSRLVESCSSGDHCGRLLNIVRSIQQIITSNLGSGGSLQSQNVGSSIEEKSNGNSGTSDGPSTNLGLIPEDLSSLSTNGNADPTRPMVVNNLSAALLHNSYGGINTNILKCGIIRHLLLLLVEYKKAHRDLISHLVLLSEKFSKGMNSIWPNCGLAHSGIQHYSLPEGNWIPVINTLQ